MLTKVYWRRGPQPNAPKLKLKGNKQPMDIIWTYDVLWVHRYLLAIVCVCVLMADAWVGGGGAPIFDRTVSARVGVCESSCIAPACLARQRGAVLVSVFTSVATWLFLSVHWR